MRRGDSVDAFNFVFSRCNFVGRRWSGPPRTAYSRLLVASHSRRAHQEQFFFENGH